MARYVYIRCSTDRQDFTQQIECVRGYFNKYGIDVKSITGIIAEKISGFHTRYKQRKLGRLLNMLQPGDVIYVSEMKRLTRRLDEIFVIPELVFNKGATIVLCGYNMILENNSISTKLFLLGVGIGAELQVADIAADTKRSLAFKRKEIENDGGFISKAGNWTTHFGRAKGYTAVPSQWKNAAEARSAKRIKWLAQSKAFRFIIAKRSEGWRQTDILSELDKMAEIDPEGYRSPAGGRITKGQLSRWWNNAAELTAEIEAYLKNEDSEVLDTSDIESFLSINTERDAAEDGSVPNLLN